MVQPRSQQIKDPQTRYSSLSFSPNQGSSQTVVSAATMHAATISDVPGGVEADSSAFILSPSLEPYPIVGGDAINVAVDGGLNVVVNFVAGDTTATRIASRINAAVGSAVSGSSAGRFFFQSLTTGPTSKFVISDNVPGTLSKIGLAPSTVLGQDAPVRGILTVAQDLLGGYVPLKTTDGRNVVTDTEYLLQNGEGFIPFNRLAVPFGGTPVHGRLTFDGTNYVISYYTRTKTRPAIRTFASNFALLDGTDSLNFAFPNVFGVLNVSFPAGPGLTRTQVIDRINLQWRQLTAPFAPDGAAHVSGSIVQPFNLQGGTIGIAVDGGSVQPVTFSFVFGGNLITDVVNSINTQVTGVTASDGGGFLVVRSNNGNGLTSSLAFYDVQGGNLLALLGIPEGLYRGYFVAEPYGPSEIIIKGGGIGSAAVITVSGPSQTQTRLGIPAGAYAGSDDAEDPATVPSFLSDPLSTYNAPSTGPYPFVALIPEVLEFGEVDIASESVTEKFGIKSAGSNTDQSKEAIGFVDVDFVPKAGIAMSGKPVLTNQKGEIHLKYMGALLNYVQNIFTQMIAGTTDPTNPLGAVVNGLYAKGIATPGTDGNNGSKSATFQIFVDPDNTFPGTRQFSVVFHGDSLAYTPFRVVDSDLITGLPAGGGAADLGQNALFGNAVNQLAIYDANTLAAGIASGGRGYVMLSAEDQGVGVEGDMYPRIFDKDVSNISTVLGSPFRRTLIKRLNSIEVSVGDGTTSFGDFNGPNAIQQAISYASTNVLAFWSLTIRVKRGTYVSASDIIVPILCRLILVGDDCGPSFINPGTNINCAPGGQTVQLMGGTYFEARNIRFGQTTVGAFPVIQGTVGSDIVAFKDCFLNSTFVHFLNYAAVNFERCNLFGSSSTGSPLIRVSSSSISTGKLTVKDSILVTSNDNPALRITSAGAAHRFGPITFDRCLVNLASTTVDGNNNMLGNCGLVELNPGFDGIIANPGSYVEEIAFLNCDVNANTSFGAVSCLMHLIPCQNGSRTNASPFIEGTHIGMKVLKLTIKGGLWTAPRSATAVNPFTVGLTYDGTGGTLRPKGGRVVIDDLAFEFDQNSSTTFDMGGATQDCGSFFTNTVTGGSAPAKAIWGAFAVAANDLQIKGLQIRGTCQQGSCGDLFVKAYNTAIVDDILITDYVLGTVGSLPDNRVRFRFSIPNGGLTAVVRNLVLRGANAPSGSWVGNDRNIISYEASVTPVTLEDFQVLYFSQSSGNSFNGFTIIDAASGSLFNGYIAVLGELTVSRMKVYGGTIGLKAVCSFLTAFAVWNIRDCEFLAQGTVGIYVQTIGCGPGYLTIDGCSVTQCGVNPGILVASDTWGALLTPNVQLSVVNITGNHAFNNGVAGNEQISLLAIGGASDSIPNAVVKSNSCGRTGLNTYGKIRASAWLSGAQAAIPTENATLRVPIDGLEMQMLANIGVFPYEIRYKQHLTGFATLHNHALLLTP